MQQLKASIFGALQCSLSSRAKLYVLL